MEDVTKGEDVAETFVTELDQFLKFDKNNEKHVNVKEENEGEENSTTSRPTKRKRYNEDYVSLEDVLSLFLRIIYPLSRDMKKFVVVGLEKTSNCKPVVMINQIGKSIMLDETAWNSLNKRLQLIDCYFLNKIFGKKTSFTLLSSNIEVDNMILRGEQYLRIRDMTKHDLKIQLSYEEFLMLHSSTGAINNYINQLHVVESCCEDYIQSTLDTLPTSTILYSPLDTSIMNRLPHEVELYRRMIMSKKTLNDAKKLQEELEELEPESDGSVVEINPQETNN
jgi:hypothetical protein